MGAGQGCEIQSFHSACQIHECATSAEMMKSSGFSPSRQFKVKLKNGTKYNDKPVQYCFVKCWIERLYKTSYEKALDYEMWVYANCIRKLVDYQVCPNFSLYYARGKRCTFQDISNIALKGENLEEGALLDALKATKHKSDKHLATIAESKNGEHDFSRVLRKRKNEHVMSTPKDWTYRLLVAEFLEGQSVADYLKSKLTLDAEVWNILLQTSIGCYAMFLSRMSHNDLFHLNNIMLVDTNETISYKVNDDHYTIDVTKKVKIFDFDRAYVESYKPNEYCSVAITNCNRVIQGLDITDVILSVCGKIKDNELLNLISNNQNVGDFKIFSGDDDEHEHLSADWYNNNIKPLPEIIAAIAKKIAFSNIPGSSVYDCSSDRFDRKGLLNFSKNPSPIAHKGDLLTQNQQLREQKDKLVAENLELKKKVSNLKKAMVVGGLVGVGSTAVGVHGLVKNSQARDSKAIQRRRSRSRAGALRD
jgi:hypothetical protein